MLISELENLEIFDEKLFLEIVKSIQINKKDEMSVELLAGFDSKNDIGGSHEKIRYIPHTVTMRNGRTVISSEEAEVIREIFKAYLGGASSKLSQRN